MSTTTTRRANSGEGEPEKRFVCTHPGCDKRFTRAEHLQRHALNHTPGQESICPRCSALFKRPDLLDRHMNRHRQKDAEAGGAGYGILDTRKRSWKAPDGTVVEKRPHPSLRGQARARPSNGHYFDHSQATQGQQERPEASIHVQHPISPLSDPHSFEHDRSSAERQDDDYLPDIYAGADDDFRFNSLGVGGGLNLNHQTYDQPWIDAFAPGPPANSGMTVNTGPSADPGQLQYEQLFQPDTAHSFNMPYTTALDYNWLFSMDDTPAPDPGSLEARHQATQVVNDMSVQGFGLSRQQRHESTKTNSQPQIITPESQHSIQQWHGSTGNTQDGNRTAPVGRTDRTNSASNISAPSTRSRRQTQRPSTTSTVSSPEQSPPEPERPLSILSKSVVLPQMDDTVRQGLLTVVSASNPSLPGDQRYSIWDHPLLSLESLQSYLNLYFTKFNTAYPLIHLPTFDPGETEPLLLLSVVLLGATYSEKDAHQVAVCIHDVMRPSIFAHAGFSARAELWTLQTILLVECFGKSRAGQKQHDMSHLFHGLLINLIRRSDCQSIRPPGPAASSPSSSGSNNAAAMDKSWRKWAEAEQKKRLAFLCFMWDTQHAALFCQSLCMSAFELGRLALPCSQTIWEAGDSTAWHAAWRASESTKEVFFLPSLKSYLVPQNPNAPLRSARLSGLSRVLVLHGLISISWDMQRRDQTSLGVVSRGARDSTTRNWREILSTAYDTWKTDFDGYCATVTAHQRRQPHVWGHRPGAGGGPSTADDGQMQTEFVAFAAAYKAVYHSAQALLGMDFLDVQIYAGARHILGRPVQQRDYLRSEQVVKRWAADGAGGRDGHATAAWHAARMLREGVAGGQMTAEAMRLFHVPWCLYLATLTCWAFHHARPARAIRPSRSGHGASRGGEFDDEDDCDGHDDHGYHDDDEGGDEMVWDPKGEMEAMVAGMAGVAEPRDLLSNQGRRRTEGLAFFMADVLSQVRWGIVHSGVIVLRGLVPMRLINQYETL